MAEPVTIRTSFGEGRKLLELIRFFVEDLGVNIFFSSFGLCAGSSPQNPAIEFIDYNKADSACVVQVRVSPYFTQRHPGLWEKLQYLMGIRIPATDMGTEQIGPAGQQNPPLGEGGSDGWDHEPWIRK